MSDEEAGDIFLVKLRIARDVIVRSAFFSLFYFCFYGFRFNHTYTKKLNKNNLSLPGRLDIFLKWKIKVIFVVTEKWTVFHIMKTLK